MLPPGPRRPPSPPLLGVARGGVGAEPVPSQHAPVRQVVLGVVVGAGLVVVAGSAAAHAVTHAGSCRVGDVVAVNVQGQVVRRLDGGQAFHAMRAGRLDTDLYRLHLQHGAPLRPGRHGARTRSAALSLAAASASAL